MAPQAMGGKRKTNSYDEEWKKGFFGSGYFVESTDSSPPVNYLKKVEQKKILSSVEKLGLLSRAEKAGLTLSKIEKLGLLSTAERLGLLATAEELLVADPARVSSSSILPFVAGLGGLVFLPDDNGVLALLKYSFVAVAFGAFFTLFIGGFILAGLQEE